MIRSVLVVFVLTLLVTATARADEVAPSFELGADLRYQARAELRRLVASMSAAERARLTGAYVAFDEDATDPFAQVACDDDGDYAIVVSAAMLRLAALLARADGDEAIDAYAALLASSQIPGRRLLPPPPGALGGADARENAKSYDTRLAEILGLVLARELARLRAGDLLCPHPTATAESQDDVWTTAERRAATAVARRLYPAPHASAPLSPSSASALPSEGARRLDRFFEGASWLGRFVPTYVRLHPPPQKA